MPHLFYFHDDVAWLMVTLNDPVANYKMQYCMKYLAYLLPEIESLTFLLCRLHICRIYSCIRWPPNC